MPMDLQALIDDAAREHDIPGAAVAIGHDGDLIEAATGVLNRNTGVAATPDSLFQIGSVTKPLTVMLVLQLVDDGLVDLDEPVRRYLPQFAVLDPVASETVTVRHLLSNTAGFSGDLFSNTGRGDDALDRYLAYLAGNAEQLHAPGALYSYCNSGFGVAGALIARLRGAPWESVLRERLIEPLGLTHMTAFAEEAILFRVAAGHLDGRVTTEWQWPRALGPAGTAVCAAPRDLVTLGRRVDGEVLAALMTPQVAVPGVPGRTAQRYGLGLGLYDWNGVGVIGHDGGTIGQAAVWRVVPSHRLVVAGALNGGDSTAFVDAVLDGIVPELTGVTVPPRAVPPGVTKPGPAEYAGSYEHSMYRYEVVATDAGLEITATGQGVAAGDHSSARYVALTDDTFISAEVEGGVHSTLTFVDGGRYLHDGRAAARIPTPS